MAGIHTGASTSPRRHSNVAGQAPTMAISSSDLALTGVYPPSSYRNFKALEELVASTSESLRRGGQHQYLAFKHVTKEDFASIKRRRARLHHARFTYFEDIQTLIIKVPSAKHEQAHANFGAQLGYKVHDMRVRLPEFSALAATEFTGANSSKEGDSCWRNNTIRPSPGYPFLVVEAGVSESARRLRTDAAWWFAHSKGDVKIVITIKVDQPKKKITIDKYFGKQVTTPATCARTRDGQTGAVWQPDKIRTVVIDTNASPSTVDVTFPSNATGAPLTLEFEKIIGRVPNPPVEHDIDFDAPLLVEWAENVFS